MRERPFRDSLWVILDAFREEQFQLPPQKVDFFLVRFLHGLVKAFWEVVGRFWGGFVIILRGGGELGRFSKTKNNKTNF